MQSINPTSREEAINQLYSYKGFHYGLYRQALKSDISLKTFINDANTYNITKEQAVTALTSDENINILADQIIQHNSIGMPFDRNVVVDNIKKYINSWINVGKFDTMPLFVSISDLLATYNKEFVQEFAEQIIPIDVTKVQSVINPDGMYAQQSRDLLFKYKRAGPRERSMRVRLEDKTLDTTMDESEDFFYKMTNTGKKIPQSTYLAGIAERENLNFKMI